MNVVVPMPRVDLAREPAFDLGGLRVSPCRRQVTAGAERETLQPRVMQVLVHLAQRRGKVVSRDELIAVCWGGQVVSDDAINRCIARLRRLAEARGGFELQTIPRIGYQLTERAVVPPKPRVARRSLVIGIVMLILVAALIAALAVMLWAPRPDGHENGRTAEVAVRPSPAGGPSTSG